MENGKAKHHVARFNMLAACAGIKSNTDLMHKFEQSLPHNIQYRVSMWPEVSTLQELQDHAITTNNAARHMNFDDNLNHHQQQTGSYSDKGKNNSSYYYRPETKTKLVPQKEYRGEPIDINRILTDKERDNHFKNGLCFKCHKHGHISHNCPDSRKADYCRTDEKKTTAPPTCSYTRSYEERREPRKWTRKEMVQAIQSMTDEQRDELYDEGFRPGPSESPKDNNDEGSNF
jgi:hypothetical protein